MFGTWTDVELRSMIDAIKFARTNLGKQTKRALRIGTNVNWHSPKQGRNKTGVVMKIAQKYVTVQCVDGAWKVPASMLSVVDEA